MLRFSTSTAKNRNSKGKKSNFQIHDVVQKTTAAGLEVSSIVAQLQEAGRTTGRCERLERKRAGERLIRRRRESSKRTSRQRDPRVESVLLSSPPRARVRAVCTTCSARRDRATHSNKFAELHVCDYTVLDCRR